MNTRNENGFINNNNDDYLQQYKSRCLFHHTLKKLSIKNEKLNKKEIMYMEKINSFTTFRL